MDAPPAGAGAVSATVQFDVAGGVTMMGVQVNPFKPGGCLMVTTFPAPVVDTGIPLPSADVAFAS
mgnify:CR=1 FL=1